MTRSAALPQPEWRDAGQTQLKDPLLEEIRRELEGVLLKRIYGGQLVDGATLPTSAQQATALKEIIARIRQEVRDDEYPFGGRGCGHEDCEICV